MENNGLTPTIALLLLCVSKNQDSKIEETNMRQFLNDKFGDELSRLPKSRIESDELDFITGYMQKLNSEYGGYFVLRTIISELANNVYDHSGDKNNVHSYICSKLHQNENKLDISIIDDGLSISGRFEISNVDFTHDCSALEMAIGTFSTVSDADFERGNGLWTIIRLIAEGNGGEILIVSRRACLHIIGEKYRYYLLNEEHIFNGTLVSVRLNSYEVQNVYDLIEFNKPNSYKLGALNDY